MQGVLSEVLLWNELKEKKLGYDFHRQKPIDEFIVDFYCEDLDLVIEIDGVTHNERLDDDAKRQKVLENFGLTVLRYLDTDVKKNLVGVIDHLKLWIKEHTPPLRGTPLQRGIRDKS
jgi:very-short-patch-repair endonuclease